MRLVRKLKNKVILLISILLLLSLLFIYIPALVDSSQLYKAKNHIIVVIYGTRYSETWGDQERRNIPNLANLLAPLGVLFTNFNNFGVTRTISGHTALITGFYEELNNSGKEYPSNPSILQRWLKLSAESREKAWFITSKGKLAALTDTKDEEWNGMFVPSHHCGVNGLGLEAGLGGKGYRDDSETWIQVKRILREFHPRLVMINFKNPDTFPSEKGWDAYLQAIQQSDDYVYQLWQLLEEDHFYRNQTALYITSDHGRHLDGHEDGFLSHGDDCRGCQHVSLLAIGPDFRKGAVVTEQYELIDLPVTIGKMLGLDIPGSKGRFMQTLFTEKENAN